MFRRIFKKSIPSQSSMGSCRPSESAPSLRQTNPRVAAIKGRIKRILVKFRKAPVPAATLSAPQNVSVDKEARNAGETGCSNVNDEEERVMVAAETSVKRKKFEKAKKAVKVGADVLLLVARLFSAVGDACPPAKAAVDGALHIVDMDRALKDDMKETEKLVSWIEEWGKFLSDTVPTVAGLLKEHEAAAVQFNCILVEAAEAVYLDSQCNWFVCLTNLRKRSSQRGRIRESVSTALEDFRFRITSYHPFQSTIPQDAQARTNAEQSGQNSPILNNHFTSSRLVCEAYIMSRQVSPVAYSCAIALLFATLCNALHFYLDASERRCFIEELPTDTVVEGHYRALEWNDQQQKYIENPNLGMQVEVDEVESGHSVTRTRGPSDGKFTFTGHEAGDHSICLSVSSSTSANTHIKLYIDVVVGSTRPNIEQDRSHISNLAQKIRDLNGKLDDIRREQQYQREREASYRDLSEATNARAVWYSVLQLGVLVATCAWQLRHLRNFFDDRKAR